MDRDHPMNCGNNGDTTKNERRPRGVAWSLVGLGLLLLVLGVVRPNATHTPPPQAKETAVIDEPGSPAAAPAIHRQPMLAANVAVDDPESAPQRETVSIAPLRRQSHPIDAKRTRIYRENAFNVALMGAMNSGDHLGLRALIEEYRQSYPEDEHQLQEGYGIVADCMERLTAGRQNAARDYWRHNRASIVRRFIRRHCLDKLAVDG
jgi:hypothetical protein